MIQLKKLTVDEMLAHPAQAYNPQVWKDKVRNWAKHSDIQFYEVVNSHNEYEEFYATYTIEEGITFFNKFGFSSSITSNGFVMVTIEPTEVVGVYQVITELVKDATGKEGRIENCRDNRRIMAKHSQLKGKIFSNCI